MANQATAYCSRFTVSLVFLCVLAHVWAPAALQNVCLNGGTTLPTGECSCPEGFDGPRCAVMSLGFDGTGFAAYLPIAGYNSTRIRLVVAPEKDTGLILYVGPYEFDSRYLTQDFVALELRGGVVVLVVDYGKGNTFVLDSRDCPAYGPQPGMPFTVELVFAKRQLEMRINTMCSLMSGLERSYRVSGSVNPGFLNRDDPLQLGGTAQDGKYLARMYEWTHKPMTKGFSGCLRNVTVNGRPFELGMPTEWYNVRPGCFRPKPKPSASKHSYLYWMLAFSLALGLLQVLVFVYDAMYPRPALFEPDDTMEMQDFGGGGGGDAGVEPDTGELRQPTVAEEELPVPTPIETIMEPYL